MKMPSGPAPPVDRLLTEFGWTRRLCGQLLAGRPTDADDVTQDLWLVALEAAPEVNGQGGRGVRPWFRRVARNLLVSRRRRQQRTVRREVEASAMLVGEAATPAELLERAEMHRLLVDLVLDLEEPVRGTVLARYFEGRSSADIAHDMEVPAGTVRWRLKQGLDQLRDRLAERLGPDTDRRLRGLLLIPAATLPRGLLLIAAPIALMLLAFGWWLLAVNRPASATAVVTIDSRALVPPNRTPHRVAATGATSSDCGADLRRVADEVARLEAQRLRRLRPDRLFREGELNLRAAVELGPVVAAMLRGDAMRFPAHAFECRTLACRLTFTEEERPPGQQVRVEPGWLVRIQTDENLRSRFGFMTTAPDPTTDPVSGKALLEHVVYLRLYDPSGRPVPPERRLQAAPSPAPVLGPVTSETCARQVQEFESRRDRLSAEVQDLRSPSERFEAAAPNPLLQQEVAAEAVRLDADGAGSQIECRGDICTSMITPNPAIGDHFKTGQRTPGLITIYSAL